MTMPHMAGRYGGDEIPKCTCGAPEEALPSQHKAVCPYSIYMESGDVHDVRDIAPPAVETTAPVGPRVHHCDCVEIIEQEVRAFRKEATAHLAGSSLNTLFLGHAEYMQQIAERIKVRQRFVAMMTDLTG